MAQPQWFGQRVILQLPVAVDEHVPWQDFTEEMEVAFWFYATNAILIVHFQVHKTNLLLFSWQSSTGAIVCRTGYLVILNGRQWKGG